MSLHDCFIRLGPVNPLEVDDPINAIPIGGDLRMGLLCRYLPVLLNGGTVPRYRGSKTSGFSISISWLDVHRGQGLKPRPPACLP